jgi:hypothetical protein
MDLLFPDWVHRFPVYDEAHQGARRHPFSVILDAGWSDWADRDYDQKEEMTFLRFPKRTGRKRDQASACPQKASPPGFSINQPWNRSFPEPL